MTTYERHNLTEDRPHVLSADCWCGPTVCIVSEHDESDDEEDDG